MSRATVAINPDSGDTLTWSPMYRVLCGPKVTRQRYHMHGAMRICRWLRRHGKGGQIVRVRS